VGMKHVDVALDLYSVSLLVMSHGIVRGFVVLLTL